MNLKNVEQTMYRSMIGSLADIMHLVCQVGRFQASPKASHLLAVKRIFRYLKGHQNMVCGIQKVNNLIYVRLLMMIGQVVLMTGRVLVEQHFFLENVLLVGQARNNQQYLYQLLKHSI